MRIRLGTAQGLYELSGNGAGDTASVRFEGRDVRALSGEWAVLDGAEVVSLTSDASGQPDGLGVNCVIQEGTGLYVGTASARLFAGDQETCAFTPVGSFDGISGRDRWFTPWGAPPDVRSLAASNDGSLLVNVHVGGVWRSDDLSHWDEVVEVGADTHQVLADNDTSVVIAAAAVGFGESDDNGATWRWTTDGLHAGYCRAVAVAGEMTLVSASTGPDTRQGAIYRRPRRSNRPFERCEKGLPAWFPFNVNTFQLAGAGEHAVLGTSDGRLFVSDDAGATWTTTAQDLPAIRCAAISKR